MIPSRPELIPPRPESIPSGRNRITESESEFRPGRKSSVPTVDGRNSILEPQKYSARTERFRPDGGRTELDSGAGPAGRNSTPAGRNQFRPAGIIPAGRNEIPAGIFSPQILINPLHIIMILEGNVCPGRNRIPAGRN